MAYYNNNIGNYMNTMMRAGMYPGYMQGGYMPRGISRGSCFTATSGVTDNNAARAYSWAQIGGALINDMGKGEDSILGKCINGVKSVIGLIGGIFKKS